MISRKQTKDAIEEWKLQSGFYSDCSLTVIKGATLYAWLSDIVLSHNTSSAFCKRSYLCPFSALGLNFDWFKLCLCFIKIWLAREVQYHCIAGCLEYAWWGYVLSSRYNTSGRSYGSSLACLTINIGYHGYASPL